MKLTGLEDDDANADQKAKMFRINDGKIGDVILDQWRGPMPAVDRVDRGR
jgi:hypothetical protein